MKTSLLLWDSVEYISPYSEHKPTYRDKELAEAAELLVKPYVVTEKDRRAADAAILKLTERPHPRWLLHRKGALSEDYEQYTMFRSKFSDEVISRLARRDLAEFPVGDPLDFATHTSLGLLMMAILAFQCAGPNKELITDRLAQYESLAKYLTFTTEGEWIERSAAIDKRLKAEDTLVTISLNVIDARSFTFEQLLTMRRREALSTAALRQNYSRVIREYTALLVQADNDAGRNAIEREFERQMKQIMAELESELKFKLGQTLLSKELLVAVLATATQTPAIIANVPPALAALIGLGALGKLGLDYVYGRNQIMRGTPLGYLYKSKKFPHY